MEGLAFFGLAGLLIWAMVAIERSRHAALVEIARLASAMAAAEGGRDPSGLDPKGNSAIGKAETPDPSSPDPSTDKEA